MRREGKQRRRIAGGKEEGEEEEGKERRGKG